MYFLNTGVVGESWSRSFVGAGSWASCPMTDAVRGRHRSSLHSWDSNGKIGSSWLVDLGGISGNIAGLSIVNLLGDNWCGLVNGGDSGSLF